MITAILFFKVLLISESLVKEFKDVLGSGKDLIV